MDKREAWVKDVLDVDLPEGQSGADALAAAQQGWAATRASVIATLRRLEGAIRAMKDPLSTPAIILIKSITMNLTAQPATKQQVAELRRYVETDTILEDAEEPNGFGIAVDIRKPLAAALAALDKAMPA
jgi:hypothetical protein